jgi:hypothetical protein
LLGSQTGGQENPVGCVIDEKFSQSEAIFSNDCKLEATIINSLDIQALSGWSLRKLVADAVALHGLIGIDNNTLCDIESSSLWLIEEKETYCQHYKSVEGEHLKSSSPSKPVYEVNV